MVLRGVRARTVNAALIGPSSLFEVASVGSCER